MAVGQSIYYAVYWLHEFFSGSKGPFLHIDDISNSNFTTQEKQAGAVKSESERPDGILESSTDAEEWRLEVERVAPHLKVKQVKLCQIDVHYSALNVFR